MEWICVNWRKYLIKDNFFLAEIRPWLILAKFGSVWRFSLGMICTLTVSNNSTLDQRHPSTTDGPSQPSHPSRGQSFSDLRDTLPNIQMGNENLKLG
jgi:hypothetical protein